MGLIKRKGKWRKGGERKRKGDKSKLWNWKPSSYVVRFSIPLFCSLLFRNFCSETLLEFFCYHLPYPLPSSISLSPPPFLLLSCILLFHRHLESPRPDLNDRIKYFPQFTVIKKNASKSRIQITYQKNCLIFFPFEIKLEIKLWKSLVSTW